MKVKLLHCTPDAANVIGDDASECYGGRTDRDSNIKRASHCKSKGHLMTMRFAYATVQISDISRVCSHQLVRIAHAGILQQSQRYVELSEIKYVIPEAIANTPFWFRLLYANKLRLDTWMYGKLIKYGVKKEDARYHVAQSCTTSLRICMNFQAWRDFLKNRNSKHAQWEIREVAVEIQRQLHGQCPELFEDPHG